MKRERNKCEYCGAYLDYGERCTCKKIDVEWCRTAYRQAADPKKQIKIMADLYDVAESDIIEVLGDIYSPDKKKMTKPKTEGNKARVARLKTLLTADVLSGMTVREAAENRGCSYTVAATHTRKLRKELKEQAKPKRPVDFMDELEKAFCGGATL